MLTEVPPAAVYANTLVFSGRMMALAFFRLEGVGLKLLRALPAVKRTSMKRILNEVDAGGYAILFRATECSS